MTPGVSVTIHAARRLECDGVAHVSGELTLRLGAGAIRTRIRFDPASAAEVEWQGGVFSFADQGIWDAAEDYARANPHATAAPEDVASEILCGAADDIWNAAR